MGTTMEELVQVRSLCEHRDQIGFCLDTCHAFASNLWNGENLNEFRKKGEELGYFNHLKAIHFNNSKYPAAQARIDTPIYLTKVTLLRINLISLSKPIHFEDCH
ncbi:TIM barrel protein [Cytobacillus firmus]|uniref:TIM barrel protein n=1 Tax=Cytobacillus firmus TaxID=1399 RepID=UPI00202FF635|nr:TIM barrel protein [Cytobacillus firmus]URT73003.1 hypothetical protein NAF01_11355 [Cytobacillus firmus]